jgi:hypothetical protein
MPILPIFHLTIRHFSLPWQIISVRLCHYIAFNHPTPPKLSKNAQPIQWDTRGEALLAYAARHADLVV